MYRLKLKNNATSHIILGMILGLGVCIPTLQAQAGKAVENVKIPIGTDTTQKILAQGEYKARAEADAQCKKAEQEAQKTIVPDAVAVIEETKKAISALTTGGKNKDALTALERASGKIDILLARRPEKSLLPVEYKVKLYDNAPILSSAIREINKALEKAIKEKNYPESRIFLNNLRSEITSRTYCLPLALYPNAISEATRLIEQKKPDEARSVLITALNTLVVVDQTIPLPILNAQVMCKLAEEKQKDDKDGALQLVSKARKELERAKDLGYSGNDREYASLDKSLHELEDQLKQNKSTTSTFSTIKEKLSAFFQRIGLAKKQSYQQ